MRSPELREITVPCQSVEVETREAFQRHSEELNLSLSTDALS